MLVIRGVASNQKDVQGKRTKGQFVLIYNQLATTRKKKKRNIIISHKIGMHLKICMQRMSQTNTQLLNIILELDVGIRSLKSELEFFGVC